MTSNTRRIPVSALAAAGALIAGAAAPAFGAPMSDSSAFTMPFDGEASIKFLSSDAGATGKLYFLGDESSGAYTLAASDDGNNLGRFLFSNKGTSVGASKDLGIFTGGSKLHFAYLITKGVNVAPKGTLSRSDIDADLLFFSLSNMTEDNGVQSFVLGVEDVKNIKKSDFDYNDAMFTVVVTPSSIPSPGSVALACCAGAFMISRRRERKGA